MVTEAQAPVIWRRDLQALAGVTSETIRRWMNSGKLPEPDVHIAWRTVGWKLSTLRKAGIDIA